MRLLLLVLLAGMALGATGAQALTASHCVSDGKTEACDVWAPAPDVLGECWKHGDFSDYWMVCA